MEKQLERTENPESLIEPRAQTEEKVFDMTLRPKRLEDFVGQKQLRKNLGVLLEAANMRKEPPEHVLLYGPPGLGKTTLSHIIAEELGVNIKATSGPALERVGDIAAILTNLEKGDVLFVDEIHRMNKVIEEVLYPAMEEYALDIVIGKGPSARTVRLDIPPFTLVGATTRMSLISSPLRERFGATYRLDFYEQDELTAIVRRSAGILGVSLPDDAAELVAARSRGTPRIANRLLKRVRDFADVKASGKITEEVSAQALAQLEIDHHGLDRIDRAILDTIISKFSGGPVGVQTLAASLSEEADTIELVHEPFLLQLGFINRTPRGRTATELAYRHLDIPYPIE